MELMHKLFRKFHLRRWLIWARPYRFTKSTFVHTKYGGTDLKKWILAGIRGYKQWYQPVDFTIARADVTTPPDWLPKPELNEDYGLGRWEYIIKRNLPEVAGKRILDVGCNVGLYSIELAKMNAKEVIGIDRTLEFNHRSDFPPTQDIVSQAIFVKEALELVNGVKYSVDYRGINFKDYSKIEELGKFDLVLALNVIYHEYEKSQLLLNTISKITDVLILQTSIGHTGNLAKWANLPKQLELLINAGFTSIQIDCPKDYLNPVIVAKK
jgi:SAM-dependent methyltransferase